MQVILSRGQIRVHSCMFLTCRRHVGGDCAIFGWWPRPSRIFHEKWNFRGCSPNLHECQIDAALSPTFRRQVGDMLPTSRQMRRHVADTSPTILLMFVMQRSYFDCILDAPHNLFTSVQVTVVYTDTNSMESDDHLGLVTLPNFGSRMFANMQVIMRRGQNRSDSWHLANCRGPRRDCGLWHDCGHDRHESFMKNEIFVAVRRVFTNVHRRQLIADLSPTCLRQVGMVAELSPICRR